MMTDMVTQSMVSTDDEQQGKSRPAGLSNAGCEQLEAAQKLLHPAREAVFVSHSRVDLGARPIDPG